MGANVRVSVGLSALLFALPVQAMTVADFKTKGEALKAKGMMAVFSSDFRLIRSELGDAGRAWRAQAASAEPAVCPPPPGKARMDEAFIREALLAVPPAERGRVQVRDALVRALNQRYRCR